MTHQISDLTFGVMPKGDGVTDDTAALRCIAGLGMAFALDPSATYLITNTVTFTNSLDFNGAEILYDGPRDRPATVFGAHDTANTDLTFNDVRVRAKVRSWANREFCGAVFNNLIRSTIRIAAIADFTTGVRLCSVASGLTHNNIHIVQINSVKYGLDLLCDGQLAVNNYLNENNFYGGDFTNHSPTLGLGDCYGHVYRAVNGGYTGHNNNVFYSPCFQPGDGEEGDVRIPVLFDNVGNANRYLWPRHETGRGPFAILDAPLDDTNINADNNEFLMGLVSGDHVVHGIEQRNGARNNRYVPFTPALQAVGEDRIFIDIFESVKAYSATQAIALGQFHFLNGGGNPVQTISAIETKKDSIHLIGSRAVGFYLEVRGGEGFVFAQSPSDNLCRLAVSVFDEDFSPLDDSAPIPPLVGQEFGHKHPWTSNYGGAYQMGSDAEHFPFRVSEQVRFIRCIATGDGNLKALSITQFHGAGQVLRPFSGLEHDNTVYVAETDFADGTVGKYREGEMVPMRGVVSGQASYHQCVTGGRLASAWVAAQDYSIGDIVAHAGNVYTCVTAGASATGPTGTGKGIQDGTVVWDYLRTKAVFVAGPVL